MSVMHEGPKNPVENEKSYDFYNQHGKEYVDLQREFYSDVPDTGRRFFREALQNGIENRVIADIGCGAGDDAVVYKQMGAKQVIGIEPSLQMLDEARKTVEEKGIEVALVAGAWEHLPLANESVDAVTARYSFHVIPDLDRGYEEVARILKQNGLFLIAAPHPKHDEKVVREQNLKPGERMRVPIFNGKFVVEIPPHTLEEYLSDTCKKYFDVTQGPVGYSMHEDLSEIDPTGLLLELRRK